jgi:hypothetical protein
MVREAIEKALAAIREEPSGRSAGSAESGAKKGDSQNGDGEENGR